MILLDPNESKSAFRAAWNIVYLYKNDLCNHTPRTKEIFENAKEVLRDFYDINEQDVKYPMMLPNGEPI